MAATKTPATGGKRAGAGRPLGAKTQPLTITPTERKKLTERLVARVAGMRISPVEVMLNDMKFRYDLAQEALTEHEIESDEEIRATWMNKAKEESAAAVEAAAKVAPYIHAKLQSVTLKGDKDAPLALSLMDAASLKARVRGVK